MEDLRYKIFCDVYTKKKMGKARVKKKAPSRADYLKFIRENKHALDAQRGAGGKRKLPNFWDPLTKNISVYNMLSNPQKYSKQQRHAVIDTLSPSQLNGIEKGVKSILNESVYPSNKDWKKLVPHNTSLRKFHQAHRNSKVQKKILKQKGGFLSILIPILTSLVGEGIGLGVGAIKDAINKKKKRHRR